MKQRLVIDFPDKGLNPNNIGHWSKTYKLRNKAKQNVKLLCLAQKIKPLKSERAGLVVTFHAPDNRRRDKDNMISSFKAAQDAISQHIKVDDAKFDIDYEIGEPSRNDGCVVIEIIGTIS